jgi:hypothetical protein
MRKTIVVLAVANLSIFAFSAVAGQAVGLHMDAANGFRIQSPPGWGPAPLVGRMAWHFASKNGTELPDCSVIVTQDPSFAILGAQEYIDSQSQDRVKQLLSLNFDNPKIGLWEPEFWLGGQKAIHYVYTGEINGFKQTSLVTQTVRAGRLYTFSCNAPSNRFPYLYKDMLQLAGTFDFIKNSIKQ